MDGRIAIEVERPARPGASGGSRMSQFGLLSLAASNGTLLNGRPLKSGEHLLKHGDIVEIAFGLVLRYFTHEEHKARSPVLSHNLAKWAKRGEVNRVGLTRSDAPQSASRTDTCTRSGKGDRSASRRQEPSRTSP